MTEPTGEVRFWWVVLPWGMALATVALLSVGAVSALRRAKHPVTGFLAVYLLVVLLWPFESARFFFPILPFLPAFVAEGIAVIFARGRREKVVSVASGVFLVASLVLLAVWGLVWRPANIGGEKGVRAGLVRMIEMAGGAGGGVGPVAVSRGPMITLYTGRKTLRAWPFDDPMMHYAEGRELSLFYFRIRREEPDEISPADRTKRVLRSMVALGVRRLVAYPPMDALSEEVIDRWARRLSLPVEREDLTFGIRVLALEGVVFDAFVR